MKHDLEITNYSCDCCKEPSTYAWMGMKALPTFLFPLPKGKAELVEVRPISVNLCPKCGHVFQAEVDKDLLVKIYSEYYGYYPYDTDESMTDVYRIPFNTFFKDQIKQKNKDKGELLEIGCSSPHTLAPFVEMGFQCVGVDPSPKSTVDTELKNIRIEQAFFEELEIDQQFDIIVSRFNLEHINDLTKHLEKARNLLREDGLFVVQVPNMAYTMANLQPNFLAHEHIHYFTPASLLTLFGQHGFTNLSLEGSDSPSMIASFCTTPPQKTEHLSATNQWLSYRTKVQQLEKDLAEIIDRKSSLSFYGCGMTLFWLLEQMGNPPTNNISIVDDNTSFHGMHLPASNHPVQAPTKQTLEDCNQIFLTLNPIYHTNVIKRLKNITTNKQIVSINGEMLNSFTL